MVIHRIPGCELPGILTLFAKNYGIRKYLEFGAPYLVKFHFFSKEFVDAYAYLHIFSQSVEELGDVELNKGYVHQGGATYHQSRESIAIIQVFFKDRVISTDLWPLRSPDVSPTDFSVGLS